MPTRVPACSIILAGGKGTRMGSPTLPKVCFPIDGVPAINRAIQAYNACGIRHHVVVVGYLAGQVVQTVGSCFANVSFAYQAEPLGTAHATKAAMAALQLLSPEGEVLVVAGDRLIDCSVLEQLCDLFYAGGCDLALLATPWREGSTQGRLVTGSDRRLLAIVEDADVRQRATFADLRQRLAGVEPVPDRAALRGLVRDRFTRGGTVKVSDAQLATAFGRLWELLRDGAGQPSTADLLEAVPEALTGFAFPQCDGTSLRLAPADVDRAALLNNSVYLVRTAALRRALEQLGRDNAQREEYLSEIVAILASPHEGGSARPRCQALRVDDPRLVLGFNDPAGLLEIEGYLQASRSDAGTRQELPPSDWYRPVQQWQSLIAAVREGRPADAPPLWAELSAVYGDDRPVLEERIDAFARILAEAAAVLGLHTPVLIVRCPGRLNVLSRHIDHQGGHCNLMTIGYETLMAVHARADDQIHLHHVDRDRFGHRQFAIGKMLADLPWEDWLSLVNSETVATALHTYGGDWSQYVTAAVLRLQKKFSRHLLRGMDMVVGGNVPMAAGLSSSSSLVVAAAEATIAVNGLLTFPAQVVDLCGEGEWFVGTRGGSADHAAVKLGQKGKVLRVTFFDFAVEEAIAFPDDHLMAVCDSGIRAQKSANARDQFNHRISCYRLGFRLIRKCCPQFASLLVHLRDVNVRTLGVPLAWIYRLLLHLPERATAAELSAMLPGEDLGPALAGHAAPADGLYPIRGVVLFGLAECERARLYADFLKAGRMADIGRLMATSHDGDRVATFDADLRPTPYQAPTSNAYLLHLMDDLESGDPARVERAQLQWQPGGYQCSLAEIDRMVDIALRTDGVLGAQLAGAGLGGCMMVLARREAVGALVERMGRHYYAPLGRPPSVLVCRPIAGAGVLLKDDSAG